MKKLLVFSVVVFLIYACSKDQMPLLVELDNQLRQNIKAQSPDGSIDFYILPDEDDLSEIPADPKNPLTEAKVTLGKLFFYETGLALDALKESGKGTYSCATCHIPEAGFRPGTAQGIADGGEGYGIKGEKRKKLQDYDETELDVQSARPLNLLNVAYVTNTFWNGQFGATGVNAGTEEHWEGAAEVNHYGFEGIESQNMEGLVTHRIQINKQILEELGYLELYDEVFADVEESERYTQATASLAFSAYLRTLLSNRAPFQDWLKGDADALPYAQKKGGILFFGKAQCYQCHFNQNLGSLEFHALGVKDMWEMPSFDTSPSDPRNLGRYAFTKDPEDLYAFKVPGIYNMEDTPFYFHGASVTSLEDLVEYKNLAVSENSNVSNEMLSSKFKSLFLTEQEKEHLVEFLRVSLRDPQLTRYKPDALPSGNCFPNNDERSRIDLGCN